MTTLAHPRKNFVKLVRRRTRQLTSSYEHVVKESKPKDVRDFRKITRHLQSMVQERGLNFGATLLLDFGVYERRKVGFGSTTRHSES